MIPSKFVGRSAGQRDGAHTTRDCATVRDSAHKTLVAVHKGRHHVAERNADGDLEVYQLHDDHGMPAHEGTYDSLPSRLRRMNIENRRFWAARGEMP
jgi:hypothetical protein